MELWHLTPDSPRAPLQPRAGDWVVLHIGTWPIEPGQAVWIRTVVEGPDGTISHGRIDAIWSHNSATNSSWRAALGPYPVGTRLSYTIYGSSSATQTIAGPFSFTLTVRPKLALALVWHQHQPCYKDTAALAQAGSYRAPWVRLHALRDYYAMAALLAAYPRVHATINLTPILIWQIEDYVAHGATDQALELTMKPAEDLTAAERDAVLATFFDADWHQQVFPHPRYKELFLQRRERQPFTAQDLRDLQMWFNLAWFGQEFRAGPVTLVTGEIVDIQPLITKGRDFSCADITMMAAEQDKILRAVLPIHRQLQDQGQLEIVTSPFAHPILPLIVDTDHATIDRPGATHPQRFAYPDDAEAQVERAVACYQRHFGRPPRGMWPAEGAVSQAIIPLFARAGVRWLATDRGVLARSGRWGYDIENPAVVCQPYRIAEHGAALSMFFRDTVGSDAIGFRYAAYANPVAAAQELLAELKRRFIAPSGDDPDRVLTIVLDGENAWGAYRDDGRPFLQALYQGIQDDPDLITVTGSEYLDGNPARGIAAHPLETQSTVAPLWAGSWIDEAGSLPGIDLGTWIGEAEENQAWDLLSQVRRAVQQSGATPASAPAAFDALYVAEGSDWFWWFGVDQDSVDDAFFDTLFRLHLKNVYHGLGMAEPAVLERHLVPHAVLWTFTDQHTTLQPHDRLTIRTNCPGILHWSLDDQEPQTAALAPTGGVMAGIHYYALTLGPFFASARTVTFRFQCTHPDCDGQDRCCQFDAYTLLVEDPVAVRT